MVARKKLKIGLAIEAAKTVMTQDTSVTPSVKEAFNGLIDAITLTGILHLSGEKRWKQW